MALGDVTGDAVVDGDGNGNPEGELSRSPEWPHATVTATKEASRKAKRVRT
jgi:hypothetical protein